MAGEKRAESLSASRVQKVTALARCTPTMTGTHSPLLGGGVPRRGGGGARPDPGRDLTGPSNTMNVQARAAAVAYIAGWSAAQATRQCVPLTV